jgi:hypothetical protein
LSAAFTVKEGHEEQMREAVARFGEGMRNAPPQLMQRIGLRHARLIMFDNDRRLMWCSSFETDWDPYVDDGLELIGVATWADWLQHTGEWQSDIAEASNAEVKAFLQSAQVRAGAFTDVLSDQTVPQIRKGQRVNEAFQQVLDDPAAEQALAQPALAPLLEQAAD